jgi:hypothetical protein
MCSRERARDRSAWCFRTWDIFQSASWTNGITDDQAARAAGGSDLTRSPRRALSSCARPCGPFPDSRGLLLGRRFVPSVARLATEGARHFPCRRHRPFRVARTACLLSRRSASPFVRGLFVLIVNGAFVARSSGCVLRRRRSVRRARRIGVPLLLFRVRILTIADSGSVCHGSHRPANSRLQADRHILRATRRAPAAAALRPRAARVRALGERPDPSSVPLPDRSS